MGVKGTVTLMSRRKDAFFCVFNSKAAIWILLKFSQTFHRQRTNLETRRIYTLLKVLSNKPTTTEVSIRAIHQMLQRAGVSAEQPPTNGHISGAKLALRSIEKWLIMEAEHY